MAATALTALQGCASAHRRAEHVGRRPERLPLTVVNRNLLDVAVYAVRDHTRFRLATVRALGRATLVLPFSAYRDGSLQLMAKPIGEPSGFASDVVSVLPDQRVELRVGSPLWASTLSVRNR